MPYLTISVRMEWMPSEKQVGVIPYSAINPTFKCVPWDIGNGEQLEITIERKPKPNI